jgi:hypothetical protein
MKAKLILTILSLTLTCFLAAPGTANAQEKKPNIVVIFGDDIGVRRMKYARTFKFQHAFSAHDFCKDDGVEKNNASA